jgi:hypothetical protein
MSLARGLMAGGYEGMPLRTEMVHATYDLAARKIPGIMTGIGGTLMFASANSILFHPGDNE